METHRDDFKAYVEYLRDTDLGSYAYRLVKDRADAQDVVRETVAEAMLRREEFDTSNGPDGLQEWLREICRRQAQSYTSLALATESRVFGDEAHRYELTEHDVEHHEELVEDAMFHYQLYRPDLTEMQEECFRAMLNGETNAATAKRLGISPQTVNQHIQYAQKKLALNPTKHPSPKRHPRQRTPEEEALQVMDALMDNILAQQEDEN